MSCTENESGPFVVFFLPAVVGCLTILLARRWANCQVSGTSSTAISRRRKIIKDPLVKRPLPPIATKMIPPGSKKAAGVAKKPTVPLPEEEINGGKRVGRTARVAPSTSPTATVNDFKLADGPMPPKHIPFPYIPQDGTLLFEAMTFIFTLTAMGLQFLNLYRTAWWLPHSYTNQAMNFYLIDPHLVAFIVTIIFRSLLLNITLAVLKYILAPKLMPHAIIAARMFILGVILGALAWCSYFIMLKYPLLKIFFLCYPAVIYFLLFGLQSGPFLELNNSDTPPMHCCSHDPQQVRDEVEVLRQDFNLRVKKILFNSIVGAYYTSFIPCCFAQSYLYYDVYGASQQVAFVWGGLFGRYASQLLPATYCDVGHRAALHLGRWRLHSTCTEGACEARAWSGAAWWPRGGRAAAGGEFAAAAQPAHAQHTRFYSVFINPSVLLCMLLCLQLSLIVLQLCLLFSNIQWHNFLSVVILLFINYYTLFKMMRDYLIAWKVYRAESMIQDKNGPVQGN
ncbi:transmembrane protein 39A [Galleria mellonella]|uniref:Transmembrane protein 39A n=1 Tax=Galleria mellonella TaxID=7137 RepID=A0A6J1W7J0_GALME|nr:transmembrane protein 39A [Galleria mellonella]